MDMSKSITFGNDTVGTGDTSVLSKVRATLLRIPGANNALR